MFSKRIPFALPLEEGEIVRKRKAILTELLEFDEDFRSIPVRQIHPSTLKRMLARYDEMFFNGYVQQKLPLLEVTLSSRLISSAGKFFCIKGPFGRVSDAGIRLSSDFLYRMKDGPFELNGLCASTPQEAFLIVFEHELCHAVETALYGKTGHSARFLALAKGLFGHTATRHKLPTRRQEAFNNGLVVGMRVRFFCENRELSGFITYIGKTATVMVPDPRGEYKDRSGRRYTKYRVPLSKLQQS